MVQPNKYITHFTWQLSTLHFSVILNMEQIHPVSYGQALFRQSKNVYPRGAVCGSRLSVPRPSSEAGDTLQRTSIQSFPPAVA